MLKIALPNFRKLAGAAAGTLVFLTIAACGGSGPSAPPTTTPPPETPPPLPAPPPVTKAAAFQFLNQTTFGATEAEAERVIDMGYEAWIDAQMLEPVSLQLPYVQSQPEPQFVFQRHNDRVHIWADNAINGPDQLRQRVAFALSEIMVVSQIGALQNSPFSVTSYYDLLAEGAFGDFRDLMEGVTLHPAMGVYLSMLGNEKPDASRNIRPDENFAREMMQLFTIGLVELNIDGSVRTDFNGDPIPTYTQEIIEGFAHVYTGWNFAGADSFRQARRNDNNQIIPMQLYPDFHDDGAKQLLNGVVLPAGQSGDQDLRQALDNIFNHANVGPFIAKRLIERLVTSNPSPQYVARVARTFNNNGSGIRGDLGAVVKAILLDPEARQATGSDTKGKLKEPLLRLTQLWRAYDARSESGRFPLGSANNFLGQGPLQSPSVFNFFSPFFAPAGEIRDRGLVAPELQIATEHQNTVLATVMAFYIYLWNSANIDTLQPNNVYIIIDEELELATDIQALIDRISAKLLAGEISATLRSEVIAMIERIPEDQPVVRVAEAIYFIVTSPEYAYQR
ncbi:MAG: DUF1800 domain-containing protein [Gammaproteobacteria bacterium]